ncbi:hypothetical protein [Gloeobacter kilaueensis]|uniref:Uncharacterized protein n=1 Tax=Gloeobacter kilaueensis (strain ATCC BAA-2537 / CCAP 1431/1 / ULC 316 / JS1) TaxID=1183438 RepID=U5QK08_GLOK1|nr:hypothetical protein [Gloeobacter kilaueensis]AGY59297.1 hypothetical protein GKIL_3051 [Gloeobacter kilaueensis JS1]
MQKIAAELEAWLEQADSSAMLDLVLELKVHEPKVEGISRSDRIAQSREAFQKIVDPIEETIRRSGGEVTSTAWLNHTILARVPAHTIKNLASFDRVEFLDLPHAINVDRLSP